LTPDVLKDGYDWAYREFYRWASIGRASLSHGTLKHQAKHFFYAAGWKKFEPLWDMMIRARQLRRMTPLLEAVLSKLTRATGARGTAEPHGNPEETGPLRRRPSLPRQSSPLVWHTGGPARG
jgi:hypothetical protein